MAGNRGQSGGCSGTNEENVLHRHRGTIDGFRLGSEND